MSILALSLLISQCVGSPLKSTDKQIIGDFHPPKEQYFNRTKAHMAELKEKIESSVNKTIEAIKDVKEKLNDAEEEIKAKVVGKVIGVVEKLTAVGDVIHQHEAATLRKLADKFDSDKPEKSTPVKTKSTSNIDAAPMVRVTTRTNGDGSSATFSTASPDAWSLLVPASEEPVHNWPGTQ